MAQSELPRFVDNRNRFTPREDGSKKPPRSERTAATNVPTPTSPAPAEDVRVKRLTHENILKHASEIPQVRGYRVMLIPVDHQDRTRGGIALPEEVLERQRNHAQVFRVCGMGPDAYADKSRFPSGPFCELGDYVVLGRYAGTRVITYYCDDLRIVNDDEIMAVVPDVESTIDLV